MDLICTLLEVLRSFSSSFYSVLLYPGCRNPVLCSGESWFVRQVKQGWILAAEQTWSNAQTEGAFRHRECSGLKCFYWLFYENPIPLYIKVQETRTSGLQSKAFWVCCFHERIAETFLYFRDTGGVTKLGFFKVDKSL